MCVYINSKFIERKRVLVFFIYTIEQRLEENKMGKMNKELLSNLNKNVGPNSRIFDFNSIHCCIHFYCAMSSVCSISSLVASSPSSLACS